MEWPTLDWADIKMIHLSRVQNISSQEPVGERPKNFNILV